MKIEYQKPWFLKPKLTQPQTNFLTRGNFTISISFQVGKDFKILPDFGKQDRKDEDLKVPDLTSFDPELLKQKYTAAFKSLYSGNQCAECGNRFSRSDASSSTSSRYSKHLDWHFRQNRKEKYEVNNKKD